jgi:hypothetical protein
VNLGGESSGTPPNVLPWLNLDGVNLGVEIFGYAPQRTPWTNLGVNLGGVNLDGVNLGGTPPNVRLQTNLVVNLGDGGVRPSMYSLVNDVYL